MRIDGLVCDLDGVVYRGSDPVAGSAEKVASLREAGVRVVFCTNNSRSTLQQYVEKLASVGVTATEADIVTSAVVTAEVLSAGSHQRAFVVGGDGIREALTGIGIEIVPDDDADLVVVGWDPTFTYEAMRGATAAVMNGARLVATNNDASFPAAEGLWPGAGAILASIETASGQRAEVMGKPHAPMMDSVARRLDGCRNIAVVGDRSDTDLAGARDRGWVSILVLTGVTDASAAGSIDPRPDLVIERLADLEID